jgi:glycosyltransferase involved in cell wall biosynthesis
LVRPSLLEGMPLLVRHGESGLLVPPGDSASLSRAILRLMGDEALREAQGRMGRRLVELGYSWDAVAAKTAAVYRELLSATQENAAS